MPATGGGEAPGEGWASLISAESLEDEIKRQVPLLSESVRTVGSFRGGAYRDAARQLSHLAVLFGVVAEHEGDVRWQDQAAGLRDLFAKAGFNCKAGSEATYNEAKQRNQDLADSIRGATFDVPDADVPAVWPEVADRRLLMLRMEEAVRERLDRWTASNDEFAANSDEVAHEAQIVGTLSRVIQHPEYEFGDDETFVDYAKDLEKYCRELVEASRQDQFEKAQSAATNVSKSCDACHADYRG